jgi:hypothetical protein
VIRKGVGAGAQPSERIQRLPEGAKVLEEVGSGAASPGAIKSSVAFASVQRAARNILVCTYGSSNVRTVVSPPNVPRALKSS